MSRKPKRRSPGNGNGKAPSPRRGHKTKQTKVTPGKDADSKVVRQTTLSFSATATQNDSTNPMTPDVSALAASALSTSITPDGHGRASRLSHPTPPPTPDRPITTNTSRTNNHTKNNKNNASESTPKDDSDDDDDGDKKPAAVQSPNRIHTPTKSIKFAESDQPEPSTPVTTTPIPPTYAEKVTTEPDSETKKPKKTNKKPPPASIPLALQTPSTTYASIRYNGFITTQPSEQPYPDFLKIFTDYFKIIQDVLGKDIYLAAWDPEQDSAFPPLKKPSKIPSTRESLGIYLGTYINPKNDGTRMYLNLRLVTYKKHPVPMEKFGIELADHLASSKHDMTIQRQPRACQATKTECIGWLMYSCKSINSSTFVPALKSALQIPDNVAVGIQYRAIAMETGKKPPYDKENPPAAAIHIDIDERFAFVYQARAASLWRKNSKQRLPNGVQLRLVPCFTSATGKSMTDTQRADAKTLKERQYYFVKEHLKQLPPYFFISQLDTPISSTNTMTLRRAMMSRAPAKQPTGRLIHNVDASWNQPSKHAITTVVGKEVEAQRFLVNMIPEFLHIYGDDASRWFTGEALRVYQGVRWNPEKGTTSSTKERNSEEMVKEDLWDLNEK